MAQFKNYAMYYDAFYQNKNYYEEAVYFDALFNKYNLGKNKSLLNLGCGTGNHDSYFEKLGYQLTGVDISADMLEIAKAKADKSGLKVDYHLGDVRNFRINKIFDAVSILFNVIGYQTTNADFDSTLAKAANHLDVNGLLAFDAWFGPAVLMDPPLPNVEKTAMIEGKEYIRKTKSLLNIFSNTISIDFSIFEASNPSAPIDSETHLMRFFFYPEIVYFLKKNRFELLSVYPSMAFKPLDSASQWNIVIIAKKIN